MSLHDTSTTTHERLSHEGMDNSDADVIIAKFTSATSESEPKGEFVLFQKLPAVVRQRIWKHGIPSGRVVDVVFDEEQDRYFSFHAIIPTVLHVSKESRTVGLKFYSFCFSTDSHTASIPFDFTTDCLMFDDWLTPALGLAPPAPIERVETRTCVSELDRVIGPMGSVEQASIHRIAISINFRLFFNHDQFVEGLKFLFNKFPSTDYLVFVLEHRDPYAAGQIYFWDFPLEEWCCEDCLVHFKTQVPAAVEEALLGSGNESTGMEQDSQRVQVRFRGVCRDGDCQTVKAWDCMNADKQEDREKELLQPYTDGESDDEDEETVKCSSGDAVQEQDTNASTNLESITEKSANTIEQTSERQEDEGLEEGELEGLLADKEEYLKSFGHLKDGRQETFLSIYGVTDHPGNTKNDQNL
jgi:hypothetical protein